jgi:hypothetical protein
LEIVMQQKFSGHRLALLTALGGAVGTANAAVDVTGITGTLTDITAVGVAVFAVFVGIKLYKWVRRAL